MIIDIHFFTLLNTDYKYDSLYRVTQVKTPEGKVISYAYDGYGRQSKRVTPDAGQTEYIYDKNNNLTYTQDANQRNEDSYKYIFRNYDGINRLTGIGENIYEIDAPGDGGQSVPDEPDNYLTINVYDTLTSSIVPGLFTAPTGYTSPLYTKGNLVATAYRTRSSDDWNFKFYKYDVRGRVIKMWNVISGFDTLITDYQYNSQNQATIYSHSRNSEAKTFRNSYDFAGRLNKVEFYVGWPDAPDPTYITLADYSYNENSQISQQFLNDGGIKNLYYYNNRGWISEILETGGLIDIINDYFKNGNVKSQQLSGSYNDNFSNTGDLSFDYTNDKSNRLLNSVGLSNKSYDLENTYDKDGNILSLKRYGSSGTLNDNFTYSYYSGTNKLQKVYGSTSQYTYDANGNMKTDEVNRNRDIKHDYRNLITQIRNKKIVIEDSLVYLTYYYYDEAGNRIRKKVYQYIGIQQPDSVESPDTEDIGDAPGVWELTNDEVYSRTADGIELAIYTNENLKQTNIWGLGNEGFITISDFPNFYVKDHLGSIRAVTDENNSVISAQDYDAWGYLLQSREYESGESVYKFTGKERDEETNYDYFGARYYDNRVANWTSIDPLLEKHYDFSPYNYVLRNPLRLIDPDGQQVDLINFGINLYSGILVGQEQNKILTGMTSEEKAEYYGMSMEEFSRGNVEATGDEMIFGDFAIVGAKIGLFATAKGIGSLTIRESSSLVSKELVKTGTQFTTHASEQMVKRQITKTMVQKTLEKGAIYWDPKNKVFNYILENKFASGKSLIVGKNLGGSVRTAYQTRVISKRMLKLSEDAQKFIRNF